MAELFSSPWFPTAALIALALVARKIRGSWLSPAAFVALIWAVYVGGCLLLTDYEVYSAGLWLIVLLIFSVQFGTVLSQGLGPNSNDPSEAETHAVSTPLTWSDRSFTFSILFTITAMAGSVYLLIFSLEKFSLGLSLVEVLSLGHLWSVARYAGEVEPWPVRLTIMWVYPAVLLAGISFATAHRRLLKYLSFAPLVPAALIGTLFAVRAGLVFSAVCWLSGFFAVRYCESRGKYALFQKRLVVSMMALVVCAFAFFVAIDTLRVFEGGEDVTARIDAPRIYKYFFGAVPAFSSWFHSTHAPEAGLGAYTFAGAFDLLGIKQRQLGIYEGFSTLSGGEETNIYTLFRSLIEDFTPAGACLFGVALGAAAGSAARPRSAVPASAVLALAGCYALILCSPLGSLFAYNGLILAWVVAIVVLGFRPHQRTFIAGAPLVA